MTAGIKQHLISDEHLSLDVLEMLVSCPTGVVSLGLSKQAITSIVRCSEFLDSKLKEPDGVFYGINTGFGYLQHVKIDSDQVAELQFNLLRSHACGVGEKVPPEIVRLMLVLKIQSLSYGHSGIQLKTVQRLLDFYNEDVLPIVFMQGSLGASGDLVPLSHLCLPLIGLGKVLYKDSVKETREVMDALGWTPLTLTSKEGLALINGTQFMSALGIQSLLKARNLLQVSSYVCALSLDAFHCSVEPFHPLIQYVRCHQGQAEVAAEVKSILEGSELAGRAKTQVQDPYSFRCIPQVHGATVDAFQYVSSVLMEEVNSVTDNPLLFPEKDLILSGGNFHGQPLALALDFLAIAMSELANISERRTYQLISGQRNLPMFLVHKPGLNSGFMIPQYVAASIVSENKQLCTPASVDSIVSSNGQEDHVSMGANAARKCLKVIENAEKVLAIEWMTGAQAVEFSRPLKTSKILEKYLDKYRSQVSFREVDTILSDDINKTIEFIKSKLRWK